MLSTASPYAFAIFDLDNAVAGVDTVYLADETVGVEKWKFDGTNWSLADTFNTTGVPPGYRGVAGYAVGKTVTLTLAFNSAVTVVGKPTLTLNDGGTATYASGSGTSALTFTYTVAAGQNTPDLMVTQVNLPSGVTIKNSAGAAANLSLSSVTQSSPQIDTTAPAAPARFPPRRP